jgi:hypothetical protein
MAWNWRELEELVTRSTTVRLVLSGHDHMGGYAVVDKVHFVTLEAVLEGGLLPVLCNVRLIIELFLSGGRVSACQGWKVSATSVSVYLHAAPKDAVAYAVLDVFDDHAVINGFGSVTSRVLRWWPGTLGVSTILRLLLQLQTRTPHRLSFTHLRGLSRSLSLFLFKVSTPLLSTGTFAHDMHVKICIVVASH